ncbi:hypothetical protein SAMN05428969_1427 [Devosia sp. YR412]|nr:hypothetical protein SAMN05428969_1427 [Devosia sp. YR412]
MRAFLFQGAAMSEMFYLLFIGNAVVLCGAAALGAYLMSRGDEAQARAEAEARRNERC